MLTTPAIHIYERITHERLQTFKCLPSFPVVMTFFSFNQTNSNNAALRRSRARVKSIDRKTVLNINRRHRSCCEFQWPPTNEQQPHVNSNAQHFDESMISKKQVGEIRDFFDNYEKNMNQLWSEMSFYERHNSLSDNMTTSKSAENVKSDEHRHEDGIAKMFYRQHFPKYQSNLSSSTPNLSKSLTVDSVGSSSSSSRLLPLRKHFYLPEDKIHSNELVKIRQHFDKSYCKQKPTRISSTLGSAGVDDKKRAGRTKYNNKHSMVLKGNFSSSSSKSYQKISTSVDSVVNDAWENNESRDAVGNLPLLQPIRITAPAIIKSNNSIACGLNDLRCGGNETEFGQQQQPDSASPSEQNNPGQKHHRSRDLKPIKSLTTSERQDLHRHRQQQEDNLILMNDDCKLLQVQDEQATTSTLTSRTCADKYCKNYQARHDKNDLEINEISTTNSRINRKHNLNLDLYFDKELSAWLSKRNRSKQIEWRTVPDGNIAITKIQIHSKSDKMIRDGDSDELKSSEKLSNETTSTVTNDADDDNSSNSHRRLSDSFSSSSTSTSTTCANSEIDMPLIDTRRHDCSCEKPDNGISRRVFTDGEYIYGPYEFDLFSNEFYQFRDSNDDELANDDEAKRLEHESRIINSALLKNHDEVDNNTEVSFVRDREADKGCGMLRNSYNNRSGNNDRVAIEINVTNCSDDDASDFTSPATRNDDVAFVGNFNYASSDACDRNLIDLMDEGDNYVSNKCAANLNGPADGDLHLARPAITTTIYAENFDAPFRDVVTLLNNSQQFNYERDKTVEITDENEYLFESPSKVECSETCDDEKFSNDERRKFIFGSNDGDGGGKHSHDDTKNKIRFKELDETIRQPGSPQLHPTDTKSDEFDNCFSTSRINPG